MPNSTFLGRLGGQQAWRHGLVYPFYVPNDLFNIQKLLAVGQLPEAVTELHKLSLLGSNSAAALLEYMCLRDATLCQADRFAVTERCRESANRRKWFRPIYPSAVCANCVR